VTQAQPIAKERSERFKAIQQLAMESSPCPAAIQHTAVLLVHMAQRPNPPAWLKRDKWAQTRREVDYSALKPLEGD